MNSNFVTIQKYKRLYSKNSAKFVRIHNGKVDGFGDKHELSGEWCELRFVPLPPTFLISINGRKVTKTS